jgi:hypothetical protein
MNPESPLNPAVHNPLSLSPTQDGGAIGDRVQSAARTTHYKAELKLDPTPKLPRRLTIQLLQSGETLWVHLSARNHQPLTSGHCPLRDCYLALGEHPALCVRESDFRVTPAEADTIRATFEPLGLTIWTGGK